MMVDDNIPSKKWLPNTKDVKEFFSNFSNIYRYVYPSYQYRLLESLALLWPDNIKDVLDVGAGNGLVSAFIAQKFPVEQVTSVDVVDRILAGLDVNFRVYDGVKLPFDDACFDVVLLVNVFHHVDMLNRDRLLAEMMRVCRHDGCILIKDHVAEGGVDHGRLYVMDAIGNLPFSGMVKARYLSRKKWMQIFNSANLHVESLDGAQYRKWPYSLVFPNRLEAVFKLTKNR